MDVEIDSPKILEELEEGELPSDEDQEESEIPSKRLKLQDSTEKMNSEDKKILDKVGEDERIMNLFWGVSDRKKILSQTQITPEELHLWGKKHNIKEKSATLRNLVLTKGMNQVRDYQTTLDKILTELGYKYEIERFHTHRPKVTTMPQMKAVSIDVRTFPSMSFYGFGLTEKEAIIMAAKRGLEYLVELS